MNSETLSLHRQSYKGGTTCPITAKTSHPPGRHCRPQRPQEICDHGQQPVWLRHHQRLQKGLHLRYERPLHHHDHDHGGAGDSEDSDEGSWCG